MRVLLVGEAPNSTIRRLRRPAEALTGAAGRRLAAAAGIPFSPDYLRRTERLNLLPEWPPGAWPIVEARLAAAEVDLTGRTAILCGYNVARSFVGFSAALFEWVDYRGGRVAFVPHPSGRNRWWNDPANRARAAAFLSDALGGRPNDEGAV